MSDFSSESIERYARQIILPEIGGAGQQKLAKARVFIIGMGGLGCPVSLYLAAAGVGTLTLIDDDCVALSNLQRQTLYTGHDLGDKKVLVARQKLRALNPDISVETVDQRLDADNAAKLMAGHDLIIEGTDNAAIRYTIADQAEALTVPLISAGVGRYDGYVTTLKPYLKDDQGAFLPRFRDFFPPLDQAETLPSCAEHGVLGALTGVMGTLVAMEAMKELACFGESLAGNLLIYDALSSRFNRIRARRS